MSSERVRGGCGAGAAALTQAAHGVLSWSLRVAGEHVEIELVAFRVRHAAPGEAVQLAGVPGLEPSSTERLDLSGGRVEVVDDEIEVHPVLPGFTFRHSLEADREAFFRGRQEEECTFPDVVSTSTPSRPHQKGARRFGSTESIARYPTFAAVTASVLSPDPSERRFRGEGQSMPNQRRRREAPNSTFDAAMSSEAGVKFPNGVGPDRKLASNRATLVPPNSM